MVGAAQSEDRKATAAGHVGLLRVREIVAMYRDPQLGGGGEVAARLMERDLEEAQQAMASGDVVRIVRAYAELKTWKGE